jgi:hypothetical protein
VDAGQPVVVGVVVERAELSALLIVLSGIRSPERRRPIHRPIRLRYADPAAAT